MKDILDELYMGEISPYTTCYHNTPELKKAFAVVDEAEQVLSVLLTGKEKTMFLNFVNAHDQIVGTVSYHSFIDGFKLGSKLFLQATPD